MYKLQTGSLVATILKTSTQGSEKKNNNKVQQQLKK